MITANTASNGIQMDKKTYKIIWVKLADIVSNKSNRRNPTPALSNIGVGVFERLKITTNEGEESDTPCLIECAFSSEANNRAEFLRLIEEHESTPETEKGVDVAKEEDWQSNIGSLAYDILHKTLIHPLRVRPAKDEEGNEIKGKWDLVAGARRYIASLYNSVKYGLRSEIPCIVLPDELTGDDDAIRISFSENLHRLQVNPMEEARWFAALMSAGVKPEDIGSQVGCSGQTVRMRTKLLDLDVKDQRKVETGVMGITEGVRKASKLDPVTTNANRPVAKTGGGSGTSLGRRSAPTIDHFQSLYDTREDLDKVSAREFIAKEILKLSDGYMEFSKWKKKLAEIEKKKEENKKGRAGRPTKEESERRKKELAAKVGLTKSEEDSE